MAQDRDKPTTGVHVASVLTALVTVVATVAGVGAAIAGLSFDSPEPTASRPPKQSPATAAQLKAMADRLDSVTAEVEGLSRTPKRGQFAAELAEVGKRVQTTRKDVADLKSAILPDPVKALQITLLSRDLERISTQADASIEDVRDDFSQLYDLTKLIAVTLGLGVLGLMVTVALAFVASRRTPRGQPAATVPE
jgi:hypothetical protein